MKKAVALLVNDMHITKNTINDFILNWDEMLEQAKANNVSTVIIGGDVFTDRSSQPLEVLITVKKCIEKAEYRGIQLVIALGNHDVVDKMAPFGYPTLFEAYPHVTVVNDAPYQFKLDGDLSLVVMRYWPEDVFPDKLEDVKKMADPSCTMLYLHEGIAGGLGDFVADDDIPNEIFKGFKAVLVGHYHNRKKIKNTNIEYIGSSKQKDFGEDDKKGYTLLFADGSYSFIQNQENMRFVTLEKDFGELDDKLEETIKDYFDDGYYVKLRVECTEAQKKTVDKEHWYGLGVTKFEFNTEEAKVSKATDEDLSKKYDSQGIKSEYPSYCDEKNCDSALGMKYLNKVLV